VALELLIQAVVLAPAQQVAEVVQAAPAEHQTLGQDYQSLLAELW
jgi:hypothetical protein